MNKSIEILNFIYDKLIHVFKEHPNTNYIIAFEKVIKEFQLLIEINESLTKLNQINELNIEKYKDVVKSLKEVILLYKSFDELKSTSLLNHYEAINQCKKIIDYHQQIKI